MRSRMLCVFIALVASAVAALAQPSIPRLERPGAEPQLIVDGTNEGACCVCPARGVAAREGPTREAGGQPVTTCA